jgi:steroid delta-isomerase-like uncharacterized protein
MSLEQNKELARRYFESCLQGDLDIFDQILAPEFHVFHIRQRGQPGPAEERGPAAFKQVIPAFRAAFPDGQIVVDDMVAEADRVTACWTFRGTHQGEYFGVPPTGQTITYSGVNGFRIKNNQLAESWDIWDTINLFQQLGLLPPTGEILAKAHNKAEA